MIGTFLFIVLSLLWSLIMMAAYGEADAQGPVGLVSLVMWFVGMIAIGYTCKYVRRYLP